MFTTVHNIQADVPVENVLAMYETLHKMASLYAELPLVFVDVGWGSDIGPCRQALPETFLNLRLDPVRMLTGTPDENIFAMAQVIGRYRGYGA